jgi:6 kDa early secretory antigenic target
MGEVTRWSAAALEDLQANLKTAHETMETATNDLEQQLEAKLTDWQGSAQEAYYAAKQEWEKALQEFNDIIMSLNGAVAQIQEGLQTTEQANAQSFQ